MAKYLILSVLLISSTFLTRCFLITHHHHHHRLKAITTTTTTIKTTTRLLPLQKEYRVSSAHASKDKFDSYLSKNPISEEEDFKRYIDYIQNTVAELEEIKKLKTNLLRLCATCDRGFAATKEDNANIADIISSLKFLSPNNNPTRGLYPNNNMSPSNDEGDDNDVPVLEGIWKLAYTTAYDVLSLNGSPLYQLQGIYQVIRSDGNSANVIDLAPRMQTLLPISIANRITSSTRAIVGTTSYARSNTRVGLSFTSVQLKPISLFGVELKNFPISVPSLKINLPQFGLISDSEKNTNNNSSGYFDIEYLDEDCLIISQNQPGGVFVSFRDYTQSFDEILN
jgi:hypothetical protein